MFNVYVYIALIHDIKLCDLFQYSEFFNKINSLQKSFVLRWVLLLDHNNNRVDRKRGIRTQKQRLELMSFRFQEERDLRSCMCLYVFFLFFFFKFYTIVLVLPYINMNPPQVYTCSPSWTLLPPPSPYHPSGSSQCTSPKHPVSCIEPGLATRFIHDIIHVSMPFSQIIPPSPSPTESKRLFYTSVSLKCFIIFLILFYF